MGRENQDFLQFFTSSSERREAFSETFNLGGILAAIIGVCCLGYVVLLCACRDSGQNKKTKDVHQLSVNTGRKSVITQNVPESRSKTEAGKQTVGGRALPASENTSSHQASSVPANARASMTRLLPAPPVSSHQTHGKQLSELPSSGVKHGSNVSDVAPHNNKQLHSKNVVASLTGAGGMSNSVNNDYEHLGPKCVAIPSDYDSLSDLKNRENNVATSAESENSDDDDDDDDDDDYSELYEKTYPEVIDVNAKRKELSGPYSKVKADIEMKEEDPYNHIGESDGTVSIQVIQQLKQSSLSHAGDSDGSVSAVFIGKLKQLLEQDDPYATVQDGSSGESRNLLTIRKVTQDITTQNATGTMDHFDVSDTLSKGERDVVEEYAVIHKTKGEVNHKAGDNEQGSEDTELSLYSVSPREPPRLYTMSDIPKHKTKHKYSQVTARESLASISARTSENPYDTVPDSPENTYTLVDGSSLKEMDIMRGAGGSEANNDIYTEIGISGGSVQLNNIRSHLENKKDVAASSTMSSSSSLNPADTANRQHISSKYNLLSKNYFTSADVAAHSSNYQGDKQYEDAEGAYVTLKEESDLLPLPDIESQKIPNSQIVLGQTSDSKTIQDVKGYADYENIDETRKHVAHNKIELTDNRVDAHGENKKVGQRRRMLDHKQQGI